LLHRAAFMADAQVPWGLAALDGAVTDPAWRSKPSWYLVATEDRMIPPDAQLARRALSARPNGEPAGRAERRNRDHWMFAELRLVVGVKPHAVIATPVAVGQDMVEGHTCPLADASQESSGRRCEGPRLERLNSNQMDLFIVAMLDACGAT